MSKSPSNIAVALAAVLCLAGYVYVYTSGVADRPIRSDGVSYYVYLPSWFLFGDTSLTKLADDCCGGEFPTFTAIIRWPATGRWVNAHPIGVAILQMPFFVGAHLLTRWTNLSPDGFTLYYQHGAGLAGLFWTIAGLLVLRDLLRRQYSDRVTAATLLAILLATNLYHFATYDSSYSHPYSFFLFAAFLNLTERWYEKPSTRVSVMLGIVGALVVLTRHTNALFLLIGPLYGLGNGALRIARREQVPARWREMLIMTVVGVLVIAPQLAMYYQSTGRLLVSSYGTLGFDFTSPHVYGVLFSVQKGVFFWSPVLLAAAGGLAMTRGPARNFLVPGVIVLLLNTWIIASWWDWQFGASYGHRGFVDVLPLFSLGLAAFFEWSGRSWRRVAVAGVCVALAASLSLFQMLQYWHGVMPMSDTTWDQYRSVFLRLR